MSNGTFENGGHVNISWKEGSPGYAVGVMGSNRDILRALTEYTAAFIADEVQQKHFSSAIVPELMGVIIQAAIHHLSMLDDESTPDLDVLTLLSFVQHLCTASAKDVSTLDADAPVKPRKTSPDASVKGSEPDAFDAIRASFAEKGKPDGKKDGK